MPRRGRRRQWLEFVGMAGFGLLFAVGGLVGSIGESGPERGVYLTTAAFGGALLTSSPMFHPHRKGGRLRQDVVHVGDRDERGVRFPYSGWYTVCALVAAMFFTLACLGLILYGGEFSRSSHRYAWLAPVVGVVGVLFFGVGSVLLALRGIGRRWRVVLVPSGVFVQHGTARIVAWPAITDVHIRQIRAPFGAREPVITVDDVSIPVRALDVESGLLSRALRFYRDNPEARTELATPAGLDRIRAGDLG